MNKFVHIVKKVLVNAVFAGIVITTTTGFTTGIANTKFGSFAGDQSKMVKCYPNPATSFVNFDFNGSVNGKDYQLQVYSFSGKKLYETAVSNQRNNLPLGNDFYRGLYIYQVKDKAGKILESGKFQVVK